MNTNQPTNQSVAPPKTTRRGRNVKLPMLPAVQRSTYLLRQSVSALFHRLLSSPFTFTELVRSPSTPKLRNNLPFARIADHLDIQYADPVPEMLALLTLASSTHLSPILHHRSLDAALNMALPPVRALTLSEKLPMARIMSASDEGATLRKNRHKSLMPPDNKLKSQVSQTFRSSISTSPFDDQVRMLDYHTQSVHYEMVMKRGIEEKSLTGEERIVFATKLVHWLQSEFRCEEKDVFSKKATKFFEINDIQKWVRQFFQDSTKPVGNTIESSAADEAPLTEGPARSDECSNVRDVDGVDGRTTNGESTETPVKRDVVEGLFQGPVSNEYDRLAGTLISVDDTDGAHIGQSKDNTNKGDVMCSPTKGSGLGGDKPASNGRLGGIECREGAHHTTEDLDNIAVSDNQATKSHPFEDWEESALEGKRVETSETRTLAEGHGNARGTEKVRTDAATSAPHVPAAGYVKARSKLDESSATKNARVQRKSAEVELLKDRSTYGRTVKTGPISRQLGELSVIDANRSNGMADEDGSVNTNPKQALSLKHELAVEIPFKKQATKTKQAGGELREKGHSRHMSVESPVIEPMAVGQIGLMSTKTPTVSDMKLEEGEHPGSHIPFPGGNRSPRFFSWSSDGQNGPYFVVVIEQSHALSGGLLGVLSLLIYVACG
ncbi:hypothetical protein PSPO01_16150 [Paraphaeosphaeria sporulosa]